MFSVGDKIVHPMHGAGQVADIVAQDVGGAMRDYYVLKISVGDMTVKTGTSSMSATEISVLLTGVSPDGCAHRAHIQSSITARAMAPTAISARLMLRLLIVI